MSDQHHTRFQYEPRGVWTSKGTPDYSDVYREVRPTLRVALQLGRWRAYAAGVWWTYRPLNETGSEA